MLPAVYEHLLGFVAALSVGWSIRLLDDALDLELDVAVGRQNLSQHLQGGTAAYAAAALALAVVASPMVALSLFAAAYAVGMFDDGRLLPTGLPGWLEGLVLFGLVLCRAGSRMAIAGLLIMVSAQLADDLRDQQLDMGCKRNRLLRLLGPVGVALLVTLACSYALHLHTWLVVYSLPVFGYFQWRERAVSRPC